MRELRVAGSVIGGFIVALWPGLIMAGTYRASVGELALLYVPAVLGVLLAWLWAVRRGRTISGLLAGLLGVLLSGVLAWAIRVWLRPAPTDSRGHHVDPLLDAIVVGSIFSIAAIGTALFVHGVIAVLRYQKEPSRAR